MAATATSTKSRKATGSLKPPKTSKTDKAFKSVKNKDAKGSGRPTLGLDPALVEKAVQALLKYHEKQSEESNKHSLLGNDRPVQVQLSLLRAPGHSTPKPIRVLIPHPLFQLADRDGDSVDEVEEPEICLIVKEESKPWCQKMIERFPDHMGCVKKVLGLQSLRKKHAQYDQRRELLNKYNFFMADDRVLPMLSKSLGKDFFKAKKLPIPINLTRKEALPFAIQKALSATYMTVSTGTCVMIRAGHTGMAPEKLAENIVEIAKNAAPKIPHKWANIQVVSIKTPESVALPVYNKTPEALKELAKLAGLEEDIETPENEASDEEITKEEEPTNTKKRDTKSPLVRALKKQKKIEKEKQKAEKKAKKQNSEGREDTKKEQKRKSLDSGEPAEISQQNMADMKKSPKQKKHRTSSEGSSKEEMKQKNDDDEMKVFIAAKKFKGSKKGYVFKKGQQGLGYYVDVKPKVDQMKLDAILRSATDGKRRGGQKRNKFKGNRRF